MEPQIPDDGDLKVEFTYDYMGRRIQKNVYTRSSGVWKQVSEKLFVYKGWNAIIESTDSGQTTTIKYYVWGLDLSHSLQGACGIGGLVATVNGYLAQYFCYDANGNVGQLVNASDGSIVAHYEYDPYGNEVVANGSEVGNNPYRFSTKYFDSETELYYYGYRYYFSELGRWLNIDPSGEDSGKNLFRFTHNDTINTLDILGLWKWKNGKRQGKRRAVVVAEKCADPYIELAEFVGLDVTQIRYWLDPRVKNDKVYKDMEFSVPNTFVIGTGILTSWVETKLGIPGGNKMVEVPAKYNQRKLYDALMRRGFFVKSYSQESGNSIDELRSAVNGFDVWGYALFGHGIITDSQEDPENGGLLWDEKQYFKYSDMTRKYLKYALKINYHCYTKLANWGEASLNYYGAWGIPLTGGVSLMIPGPTLLKYLGTWDGLVGSVADKDNPIADEPALF